MINRPEIASTSRNEGGNGGGLDSKEVRFAPLTSGSKNGRQEGGEGRGKEGEGGSEEEEDGGATAAEKVARKRDKARRKKERKAER